MRRKQRLPPRLGNTLRKLESRKLQYVFIWSVLSIGLFSAQLWVCIQELSQSCGVVCHNSCYFQSVKCKLKLFIAIQNPKVCLVDKTDASLSLA